MKKEEVEIKMGMMDFFYNGVELKDKNESLNRTRLAPAQKQEWQEERLENLPRQDYPRVMRVQSQTNWGREEHKPMKSGIMVYYPQSYEDAQFLIDHIKGGTPIIVDLSKVKEMAAQRILDIMSGAVYALDGSVAKIQASLFLLTLGEVDINLPR